MCYRCELCRNLVPHNTAKLTVIITREVQRAPRPVSPYEANEISSHRVPQPTTRTEIAREIAVCADCKAKSFEKKFKKSPSNIELVIPGMKEVVKRSRMSHRFSTVSPENNL